MVFNIDNQKLKEVFSREHWFLEYLYSIRMVAEYTKGCEWILESVDTAIERAKKEHNTSFMIPHYKETSIGFNVEWTCLECKSKSI